MTTAIFRFHRGTLEESLKTSTAVSGFDDICRLVADPLCFDNLEAKDITCTFYGFDQRINEKLYTIKCCDQLVGFTNKAIC